MIKSILKPFIVILALLSSTTILNSQTAGLLPMAVQQFFNNNGDPLSSGSVSFYIPNTFTPKTTWQDANQATAWPTTITLNAAGRPPNDKGIYGNGIYRQIVKDSDGNTIWDNVTEATGSNGGGTLVGDGNLVGTVLPWTGFVAPAQYVFAYGQEIVREDYEDFFNAVTIKQNAVCTSASTTLSGLSDTTQLPIGAPIEVECVPPGTVIVSKATNSVVMNNPASISVATTARFFPWGNGDGSITFNVPDLRGRSFFGRDNMGGSAAGRLTSTYFANASAIGAYGGSQSTTLSDTNLPAHHHSVYLNDPGHNHSTSNECCVVGSTFQAGVGFAVQLSGSTGSNTTGITVRSASGGGGVQNQTADTGTSNPFSNVPPAITLNWVIKISKDVSTSVANGVLSIEGMTGALACGQNLLCVSNVISASLDPIPNNTIMGNVTGDYAPPTAITLSQLLDTLTTEQGSLLYRGATEWATISPGTLGEVLSTQGAGANPIWVAANPGTVTGVSIDAGQGIVQSGSPITGAGTITVAMDPSFFPNYLTGYNTANDTTDATNDIVINTGVGMSDDNTTFIKLSSQLIKQTDAAWAVGTNQGCVDTGSLSATGTVHFFAIERTDHSAKDILCSNSLSPTMPANYTYKRRIASLLRVSSAMVAYIQSGNQFNLGTPVLDVNANNPGVSAVLAALSVPNDINVTAIFNGGIAFTTVVSGGGVVYFSDPATTDLAGSVSSSPLGFSGTIAASGGYSGVSYFYSTGQVRTNTSKQIRYRLNQSDGNITVKIATTGWIDTRGQQ